MTKQAQEIWDQYYMERTEMLFSKEEYIEYTHAYSKMKAKVMEVQDQVRHQEGLNPNMTMTPEDLRILEQLEQQLN